MPSVTRWSCFAPAEPITTSINDWDIEQALELDSYHEGALAILGCGFATGAAPAGPTAPGSLPFAPYTR